MFRSGGTVGVGHPHAAGFVLGDVGDLGIAAQLDIWTLGQVGAQQLLQLGLVEHVGLREAVPAAGRVAVELCQRVVVLVE
jgi:hypothetical protein